MFFFYWLNLCKISARCNGFATALNGAFPSLFFEIKLFPPEYTRTISNMGLSVQTMAFMGLSIAR